MAEKERETVRVCFGCGKLENAKGWDISCHIHAQQCCRDRLEFGEDGRVKAVKDGGIVEGEE